MRGPGPTLSSPPAQDNGSSSGIKNRNQSFICPGASLQMGVPGFVSSGQATLGSLFVPFSVYFYFAFVYFVCTHGGRWQAHATVSVHTWGRVAGTRHYQCAHVGAGCKHKSLSVCTCGGRLQAHTTVNVHAHVGAGCRHTPLSVCTRGGQNTAFGR